MTDQRVRVDRDALADALAAAARVTKRAGLASTSGVRVVAGAGRLVATGTDLDTTIEASTGCDGDFSAVLPARLAAEAVKSLEPGAVTLRVGKHNAVTLSGGRCSFELHGYSLDDFPRVAEVDAEEVTVAAADLAGALGQVVGAASTDDGRAILTGVRFEGTEAGLRLVATDSYRLAVRDVEGVSLVEPGQAVLVPRASLAELARMLERSDEKVRVRIGATAATFTLERFRITTRLIAGEFPDYGRLIPADPPNRLVVNTGSLAAAVGRMMAVAPAAAPVLRFDLGATEGLLGLNIVQSGIGEASEEVDATYDGAPMTIAFNPRFLRFGVEAAGGDTAEVGITDAVHPAVIRGADPAFVYVLMPVRVQ